MKKMAIRSVRVFGIATLIALAILFIPRQVQKIRIANRASTMPNVIFIMVDTLRADHVHCYGYGRNTTPNVDQLAAASTRYESAISQAPKTSLSVPSFLTSEYPQDRLDSYDNSLTEVLKNNGYVAGAVVSNLEAATTYGLKSQPWDFWDEKLCRQSVSSDQVTTKALDWISKQKSTRSKRQPFFLFALYMDPHTPYVGHQNHLFDPGYKGPCKDKADFYQGDNKRVTPPCSKEHLAALYDSDIAFTDENIGKLISGLKKNGLYDNTLIVFLSDHGEELGDHGDYFHAKFLYKESLSVPLIVKLPNQHDAKVVRGTFSLIDLAPSVLNCLGISPKELNPLGDTVDLRSSDALKDKYIYSAIDPSLRSVRNSRYTMIKGSGPITPKGVDQLFDRQSDPKELRNIAKQNRGVFDTMSNLMDKLDKLNADAAHKSKKPHKVIQVTDEDKERLKSLGYLGN